MKFSQLTAVASSTCLALCAHAADPKQNTTVVSTTLEVSAYGLNRLTLPVQVMQQSRYRDLRDLRVVNGSGQVLPLARINNTAAQQEATKKNIPLTMYPVYSNSASGGSTAISGETKFRFEESNGRKVVEIDLGQAKPVGKSGAEQRIMVGVLLDLRTIKEPIEKLGLKIKMPMGRPIGIQVRSSKDLQQWRTVRASASVYRFAAIDAAAAPIEETSIDLSSTSLQDDYLQLDWSSESSSANSASDLANSIEVQAVTALVSSRNQKTLALYEVKVPVNAVTGKTGVYQFSLPYAPHAQSLTIRPAQMNTLVPFVLSTEQAPIKANSDVISTPIARSVAFRLKKEQTEMLNPALAISIERADTSFNVQGEQNAVAFTNPPEITAQMMPIDLAFVASVPGPFKLEVQRLAADNPGTTLLPIGTLIPGYQFGDESKLASAKINSDAIITTASTAGETEPKSSMPPTKTLMLWGILFAGVLLLAYLAFSLSKQKD
jgi:Protein of unknown function (DUF3999)